MILHRLTIKGVLAFTDAVTVDFDALPEGLIAISGPNGSGKTSLLEAAFACLYRRFPSRAGALVDYATARDAYLSLTFGLPGKGQYTATVRLDHVSRASSAVLEHVPDGAGAPLLLNDGKVSTYDQVIADLLPPPELLLASAFAAQSRAGSFLTASRTERRALFATLLGLDHYERHAETAKAVRAAYTATSDTLTGMRRILEASDFPMVLATSNAVVDETERRLVEVGDEMDALAAQTATLTEAVTRAEARSAEATRWYDVLNTARKDLELAAIVARSLDTETTMAAKAREDAFLAARETRDRTVADLDERIANNRALLDKATAIRQEADAYQQATEALAALSNESAGLREDLAAAKDAVHAAAVEVGRVDADHQQATLLTTVPCRGEGVYAGCGFLQSALLAKARLAGADAIRAAHTDAVAHFGSIQVALDEVAKKSYAIQATLTPHLSKAPDALMRLNAAEARVRELEADRAAAGERAEAAIATATRTWQAAEAEIATKRASLAETVRERQARKAEAEAALDGFDGAEADAIRARADLASHQQRVEATRYEWQRAHDAVAAAHTRRQEAEAGLAQLARLDTLQARVDASRATWGVVVDACSRTGIPTLEMDAAGPTVSSYCNDLLLGCFGGRFTVDLITQDAKADGKGLKEVFEVRVYDATRGGAAVDILDLSGGERVIVDEALKCAIAQLVNDRGDWPVLTLWRDETTGALDPVNATRYVEMLRRLAQRAGVRHILFITHMPEAARQADAQIHVGGVALRLAFPPYPQED